MDTSVSVYVHLHPELLCDSPAPLSGTDEGLSLRRIAWKLGPQSFMPGPPPLLFLSLTSLNYILAIYTHTGPCWSDGFLV